MKRIVVAVALLAASPALAEGDFAAGSEAKSWGLAGEANAIFEATVIDALCYMTGDCLEDCGAGKRQMGVLRLDDDRFLLANKNGQPVFTGATVDLAPYCGQTVEVDGLLVGDPEITPGITGAKLFQVQTVRVIDTDAVQKTNLWTQDWAKRNTAVGGDGPWYERDPNVAAEIEANGRLGLGAGADLKYIEENF